MNRVLIRAGRPPHDTTPVEAAFAWQRMGHYAGNTGNMLFSDTVYRMLNTPTTDLTCDAYEAERRRFTDAQIDYVNENFDRYVIPLANAIRPGFAARQLARLADFVERLTIPVVVTGIGSQSMIGGSVFELPEEDRRAAQRFLAAVLDRSASVGVRGEATRQALLDLGFHDSDIEVVGCPSMLRNGPDFRVERKVDVLTRESRIAFNAEAVETTARVGDLYRDNERAHPGMISVYQTSSGGQLILWGRTADDFPDGVPASIDHPAYQEGRLRFFTNPRPWQDFMLDMDFAFGTRIHGNAAALAAGTPAFVLTIDSRTQELTDYHAIPAKPLEQVMRSGRYLAQDLYESCDLEAMNARLPTAWARFVTFLDDNDLEHIHRPGMANPEYEKLLAKAPIPDGVGPLVTSDSQTVASRIAWLWGDREFDVRRPGRRRYRPDLRVYGGDPRTHIRFIMDVERAERQDRKRLAAQEAKIAALEKELATMRAQLRSIQESRPRRRIARAMRRVGLRR
jgi:Polysaccharide pyruvyl transferase